MPELEDGSKAFAFVYVWKDEFRDQLDYEGEWSYEAWREDNLHHWIKELETMESGHPTNR